MINQIIIGTKRIKAVIFDLDGTIADTLPLCIAAFKKSIEPLAGKQFTDEEIVATFGPSEEGTIQQLIPDHYSAGLQAYYENYASMHSMCLHPFEGIVDLLDDLDRYQIMVALVTGKGRQSADISLSKFDLANRFKVMETGSPHGPRKVEGIKSVLESLAVKPEESIYIGDAPSDIVAARKAGVLAFGATWAEGTNAEQVAEMQPDQMFKSVSELRHFFSEKASTVLTENILLAFQKIKSIADIGLLYCKDDYEKERYSELENIALESISQLTDRNISTIKNFYDKAQDYPTPKVDVRAFIINRENEILMVKEKADGRWTLPGGWADVGFTASESVVKEVKEETGLTVKATQLLAVFDKKNHPHPPQPYYVYKFVFLCEVIGEVKFHQAFDILDISFHNIHELPQLSEDRILKSQIDTLFQHYEKGQSLSIFD